MAPEERRGTKQQNFPPPAFDVLFESAQSARLAQASSAVHQTDVEGVRDVVYSKLVTNLRDCRQCTSKATRVLGVSFCSESHSSLASSQ